MTATRMEALALPREIKVIWQAVCMPKMTIAPQYIRITLAAKIFSSGSGVKIPAKSWGKSMISAQRNAA